VTEKGRSCRNRKESGEAVLKEEEVESKGDDVPNTDKIK